MIANAEGDVNTRRALGRGLKVANLIIEEYLRAQNIENVLLLNTSEQKQLVSLKAEILHRIK